MRETKKERITVVNARCDQAVNKDGSGVNGKGGAETVDITEMEIS